MTGRFPLHACGRAAGLALALALLAGSGSSPGLAEPAIEPPTVAELPEASTVPPADEPRFVAPLEQAEQVLEAFESGLASWYGREFAGRRTASGERFNPDLFTAAHRTLPFGSKVRVTHLGSGKSVVVRINDRGPFRRGRVIDLSQAAAQELGITRAGEGRVSLALVAS